MARNRLEIQLPAWQPNCLELSGPPQLRELWLRRAWQPTRFALRTHAYLPAPHYDLGRKKRKSLAEAVAAARALDETGTIFRISSYPWTSTGIGFVGVWRDDMLDKLRVFDAFPAWHMWEDLCLWNSMATFLTSVTHECELHCHDGNFAGEPMEGARVLAAPQGCVVGEVLSERELAGFAE